METSALTEVRKHLRAGRVYRREDLVQWSASVDRHLRTLVGEGDLKKLRYGLYYCPKRFAFGEAPASEHELVQAFLKTDHFVVTSPNLYNQLGLGTTQLYNKRVVYNRKRHGHFLLDGRRFSFRRPKSFPPTLSKEFLYVDALNNKKELLEDTSRLESLVATRIKRSDQKKLLVVAKRYGKVATRKFFEALVY